MPILFSENKIQFGTGSGKIKFSSEPEECECCGPGIECLCPEGSEFAAPKVLTEISMIVTDMPASYTDSVDLTMSTPGVNTLTTERREATITISGFDDLNGTYVFPLFAINDDEDDNICVDSMSACAYDNALRRCQYRGGPKAVLTGTYNITVTTQTTGSPPSVQTFNLEICGEATILFTSSPSPANPETDGGAYLKASFAIFQTVGGYCDYGHAVDMFISNLDSKSQISWASRVVFGGQFIGSATRPDCDVVAPPQDLVSGFPIMMSQNLLGAAYIRGGPFCCLSLLATDVLTYSTIRCSDLDKFLTEVALPACSGTDSTSLPGVPGQPARTLDRIWNSSQFDFNVDWDYTLV